MRNLLMVGAASVALLSATQAMAQSATSLVTADKPIICGVVSNLEPINVSASTTAAGEGSDDFQLFCDDPAGANVTVISTNGELKHTFIGSTEGLDYDVTLSSAVLTATSAALNETASQIGGTPVAIDVDLDPLQVDLAVPTSDNANLAIKVQENPTFGGDYQDTLTVTISQI